MITYYKHTQIPLFFKLESDTLVMYHIMNSDEVKGINKITSEARFNQFTASLSSNITGSDETEFEAAKTIVLGSF